MLLESVLESMDLELGSETPGGDTQEEASDLLSESVKYEVLIWPPPPLMASTTRQPGEEVWPEQAAPLAAIADMAREPIPLMDGLVEEESKQPKPCAKAQKRKAHHMGSFELDHVDLERLEQDLQIHESGHHAISKHMRKCPEAAKAKSKAKGKENLCAAQNKAKGKAAAKDKEGKPAAKCEGLSMTRKCVYSRKYHETLQQERLQKTPEEEAKARARQAAKQAVDGMH